MDFLQVSGISRKEDNEITLHPTSFTQKQFHKIAIAGETGSGKSSLLKIIAGLMQPETGEVRFEGKRILGPAEKLIPGHPGIVYLSQQFELPNYLTVEQVLEYANLLPDEESDKLYEVCHIKHLVKRRTDHLSGGEKQRIALAKLLVTSPKLLLLDEPFSNLDMIHKATLKKVIHDLGEKLNITCLLVSHDPLDTLSWADELLVMKDGSIVQQGTPLKIYTQPADAYVAGLFGKYNLIAGKEVINLFNIDAIDAHEKNIFIRPEWFTVVPGNDSNITCKVKQVFFLGSAYETEVLLHGNVVTVRSATCNWKKDDEISLSLSLNSTWYI